MKTSKIVGITSFTACAALLIAYQLYGVKQNKKDDIELVKKALTEIPVTTTIVQLDIVKMNIAYHGTFEPLCEVNVVSESQGKVMKFAINEGDFISEGETIVWLDNDLIGYQLEIAEAAYLKARDDLKKFEELSVGEAVSVQQMKEVKLAFTNTKNMYLTTKKQFENAVIKAPVSGTISKRYFEKGTFVAPGSQVADIIDTRKMKFNAWFTAADLTHVQAGQMVALTTDLYPGETFKGYIKVIGVKPDNSRRYLVQAEVENSLKKPLISGIDGTIHIPHTTDNKRLVIPRNCIINSSIEPMVYVVSDNTAKLRVIVISEIIDNQAVIESGLTEGELVVVSGQINLEDNTRVAILSDQNL